MHKCSIAPAIWTCSSSATPPKMPRARKILRELVNAVAERARTARRSLIFCDRAALVADADTFDDRAAVTLMTLPQRERSRIRSRVSHRPGRRSFSAQPLDGYAGANRRGAPSLLRGYDACKGNSHADARGLPPRLRQRARRRVAVRSRFLAEIPGEMIETAAGSLADAGADTPLRGRPRILLLHRRIRAARAALSRRSETARALLAPARTPRTRTPAAGGHPLVGVRVRHPTTASEQLSTSMASDDDRKLTVSFSDHGTKKLSRAFRKSDPRLD